MKVKVIIFTVIFLGLVSPGYSEESELGPKFEVRVEGEDSSTDVTDIANKVFKNSVGVFYIKTKETDNNEYKLFLYEEKNEKEIGTFKGDGQEHKIESKEGDLRHKTIKIKEGKNEVGILLFQKSRMGKDIDNDQSGANDGKSLPVLEWHPKSAYEIMKEKFENLEPSRYGLRVLDKEDNETIYSGANYVHVFFDQFGKNLMSTIPQGIAGLQYVVHIFFLADKENSSRISYSVKQTEGEFEDIIVHRNIGQFPEEIELTGLPEESPFVWRHFEWLLSTSTKDIKFGIYREEVDPKTKKVKGTLMSTNIIKMTKVYHTSFDIGLFSSKLENPTYELATSPDDKDKKVVKMSNTGKRGVATAMVTFYYSPVVLLEKLFNKDIPTYKLTGRNFLNDHNLIERIFPAIGVGISDKALENLFFGLNWEIARGASFFIGFHYGKINTFDPPEDFEFGKTEISEAEFNLRKDFKWDSALVLGANIDISIVSNLFKKN